MRARTVSSGGSSWAATWGPKGAVAEAMAQTSSFFKDRQTRTAQRAAKKKRAL